MYQAKANEEYVKIGFTSRTIEARLDEWSFQCNREISIVYPPAQQRSPIPCAKRAEMGFYSAPTLTRPPGYYTKRLVRSTVYCITLRAIHGMENKH
jgi:hypothetical protein